jgi:predicted metal-dependent hydrolase
MQLEMSNYEEKYLAGLRLFNEEEFFDSHDVLEELWQETAGPEKKFYQGLIQLAISLFHFGNGNLGGAKKLYESSRKYLEAYRPNYLGLDVDKLLADHAACFAELLSSADAYPSHIELRDDLIPKVEIPN